MTRSELLIVSEDGLLYGVCRVERGWTVAWN